MFTRNDILSLLQTASASPECFSTLQYVENIAGTCILASSHVRKDVNKLIDEFKTRTSVSELARKLDVDGKYVQECLPLERDDWAQIGQQIIPRTEFTQLSNKLSVEATTRVVQVPLFCRKYDIQLDTLEKLLEYNERADEASYQWLDIKRSLLCSNGFYQKQEEEIIEILGHTERPIALSSLTTSKKDTALPEEIIIKIVTALIKQQRLKGTLNGSTYTSELMQLSLKDAALADFEEHGVIDAKSLKKAGIDKVEVTMRKMYPGVKYLKGNFVSEKFVQALEAKATTSLDTFGYADFQHDTLSSEEVIMLKDSFAAQHKRKRKLHEAGRYLVSHELIDRLDGIAQAHAINRAAIAWESRLNDDSIPQNSPWQHSVQFATPSIPVEMLDIILLAMREKIATVHNTQYAELRDDHNDTLKRRFILDGFLPLVVYMRGIESVIDPSFKDMLYNSLSKDTLPQLIDALNNLKDSLVDVDDDVTYIKHKIYEVENINQEKDSSSEQKSHEIFQVLSSLVKGIGLDLPESTTILICRQRMVDALAIDLQSKTDSELLLTVLIVLHTRGLMDEEGGILNATVLVNHKHNASLESSSSNNLRFSEHIHPMIAMITQNLPAENIVLLESVAQKIEQGLPISDEVNQQLRHMLQV